MAATCEIDWTNIVILDKARFFSFQYQETIEAHIIILFQYIRDVTDVGIPEPELDAKQR